MFNITGVHSREEEKERNDGGARSADCRDERESGGEGRKMTLATG